MNSLKPYALTLASQGRPVFPLHYPINGACSCGESTCESPAKHPIAALVPHGHLDATTNPAKIEAWWSAYPLANIGERCGEDIGRITLDGDPRNGGDETLAELEAQYGKLPETATVYTGGDGWHKKFKHPGGRLKGEAGPGIDIKNNGYVVAPPSLHISGKRYTNANEVALAELPEAWLAVVRADTFNGVEQVKVKRAGRNNELTSIAGKLQRAGCDVDTIEAALLTQNEKQFANHANGPLGEDEVRRIARGITRYPPADNTRPAPTVKSIQHALKLDKRQKDILGPVLQQAPLTEEQMPAVIGHLVTHFGEASDAVLMEVLGESVKANRDKATQLVKHYRAKEAEWRVRLGLDEPGMEALTWRGRELLATGENLRILLQCAPNLARTLRFDVFAQRPERRVNGLWRPLHDTDYTDIADYLTRVYEVQFASEVVRSRVEFVAYVNSYDPVLEYLNGLKWDGTERLSTWLPDYFGTPNDKRHQALGRQILIGLVARQFNPGEKVDTVPIFEGLQGTFKSTTMEALVPNPDWFSDTPFDIGSKDSYIALCGKLVIELGELETLRRSEAEAYKGFLSAKRDTYRPPYGRNPVTIPRRNIFVGTTNASEYLQDPSGARRFPGIECGTIKLEEFKQTRDQLWAEAVIAYKAGEKWYHTDATLIEEEKELAASRQVQNLYTEPIDEWLATEKPSCFTMTELLVSALHKTHHDKVNTRDIAALLNARDWRSKKVPTFSQRSLRLYIFKGRLPDSANVTKAENRHARAVEEFNRSLEPRRPLVNYLPEKVQDSKGMN